MGQKRPHLGASGSVVKKTDRGETDNFSNGSGTNGMARSRGDLLEGGDLGQNK